mmetsp:Transcript_14924/g.34015  ORF Transcript_14924/g.34015 Transcript_14924/m.34015 type:complete len:375 (+) Transcript_14924:56-1180(+)
MTSLTVELGLRRKRGNSPTIPDQLANRQDVTLAQKQRLAMLAKMGLGPAGGAGPPPSSRLPSSDDVAESRASGAAPSSSNDRRRALLERERRARELEELAFQEEEERLERDRKAKQARPNLGIQKLGPVMARKEEIPQFLPSPAQVSAPPDAKMQVNISRATMERVKAATVPLGEVAVENDVDDVLANEEDLLPEEKSPGPPLDKKRTASPGEAQRQKAKKKKAKRTVRDEDDKDERRRKDDEEWEDDEDSEDVEKKSSILSSLLPPTSSQNNKRQMVVESIKGKVTTANRNFTDADLEKRFQVNERDGIHGGSLMTEEEALRMIRKEKNEKGAAGSAARRIQRDLAEWAATKELQRQRVKSPHRFERMVVSRK